MDLLSTIFASATAVEPFCDDVPPPPDRGGVYLVGAGPGDPDLLTVKACRLIKTAHIVIYDRLVSEEIVKLIPNATEKLFAGKASGDHVLTQAQINQALVCNGMQPGRIVLRLKAGDPYIFGRGGEEADVLVKYGIDFEVVPGITAASGCSAYAGIPLTYRGIANRVQFITGQAQIAASLSQYCWEKLVDKDCTLAMYMGLDTIGLVCQKLQGAGMPPETPAAAIQSGTTVNQKCVISTVGNLAHDVIKHNLQPPTLFIVGHVVSLANTLSWFKPGNPPAGPI